MRLILILVFLNSTIGLAQNSLREKWYDGEATVTGSDMEKIHLEALNRARSDALKKAGVEVVSRALSLKSEEDNKLLDFFSEFTESNSRGVILDEKVIYDRPEPVDSSYMVYTVTAHVHALVGLPEGESDPGFDVKITTDRDIYNEYEPVKLRVRTTKPGFLTILDIHNDLIKVLFPNVINRNNYISPDKEFVFPPGDAYSLEFEVEKGKSNSTDMIIAVVTEDNVPFPDDKKIGLEGSRLIMGEKSLTTYARWLYRIPLNRRSSDLKLIHVERGNN